MKIKSMSGNTRVSAVKSKTHRAEERRQRKATNNLHSLFIKQSLVILSLVLLSCQPASLPPEPTVSSMLANAAAHPDGFYPLEWAEIGVDVYGDSRIGPEVKAKVDLVFLIDESGSMLVTDELRIRHRAVKDVLDELDPNQYRVGIIVFANSVEILGGYSELTTNFAELSNHIDALSIPDPNALTNIADAMGLANSLLSNSTANHRVAILLTDGYPTSETYIGYDLDQDAEINTVHKPYAIEHDINYIVVHLRDTWVPDGITLLMELAEDTYRTDAYLEAQDAEQLLELIPKVVNEVSSMLVLKDVSINVYFRMGPNEYSEIDENNIFFSEGPQYQTSATSVITEPKRQLPDFQVLSLRIPITSHDPFPPETPLEVTEILLPSLTPEATVSYHLGDNAILTKTIGQVMVKWLRPPEVLVYKKSIDPPGSRHVTISVTNYIPEASIEDVRLREILSSLFEAVLPSASPTPNYIVTSRGYTWLLWDLGDIAPLETKEVSFDVRYHGPTEGVISVDMKKPEAIVSFTDPDGVRKKISSAATDPDSMWYGDTEIEASILNVTPQEAAAGPDLMIYSHHDIDWPLDGVLSTIPKSYSIWNDAYAVDGYDEEAISADYANPEPLDLDDENRLWIRVDNIWDKASSGGIEAQVYIKPSYQGVPSDLDVNNWHLLGSVNFGTAPISANSFKVGYFRWYPPELLTTLLVGQLESVGHAFFKVVISYAGSELWLNNNTAVKMIPIAP